MQDDRTALTGIKLRPPRRRYGPGELARGFLAFRETWDLPWEIAEALMTAGIFGLLCLGYEEQERFAGLLSHVLVGLLLLLKFVSIVIDGWMRRHPPGLGID